MKLIHLSDLHIGKRVNEFSMIEDQEYILDEIIRIIEEEKPDGIMIAGDIYDKAIPSSEAVLLFDSFLVKMAKAKYPVFIISGNHDSPERLAFASRLINQSGVYMSPVYRGKVEPITLSDDYGEVDIYMLPFIKPVNVRQYFPEAEINSYTDALRVAIDHMNVDEKKRNIIITHQFVTGASTCESEEISVGGSDNVDSGVFSSFDYVALGHIHGPQKVGEERIRYCGTPLKYSFSEANHNKSVSVVELFEKGNIQLRTIPLTPLRDMREIRGSYGQITAKSFYEDMNREDYLHITLTDEEDILDAIGKLRSIYPNIMKLDYDNIRTRSAGTVSSIEHLEKKMPIDLFSELYKIQNNQDISPVQREYLEALIDRVWEGE